jgi:malonyl-CoA O-methyltransferase
VRAALGDVRGLAALDLRCGTGRHTLRLAESGATVTAVDFSDGMLAEALRKPGAERVRFLVHDLHQPLPCHGRSLHRRRNPLRPKPARTVIL